MPTLPRSESMSRWLNTSRTRPRPLRGEQLAAIGGHDARGILAAVLQHRQRVIELLVDRASTTMPTIPHMWPPARPVNRERSILRCRT